MGHETRSEEPPKVGGPLYRSVLLFYEGGTTHTYESIRVARFNLDWLTQRNQ